LEHRAAHQHIAQPLYRPPLTGSTTRVLSLSLSCRCTIRHQRTRSRLETPCHLYVFWYSYLTAIKLLGTDHGQQYVKLEPVEPGHGTQSDVKRSRGDEKLAASYESSARRYQPIHFSRGKKGKLSKLSSTSLLKETLTGTLSFVFSFDSITQQAKLHFQPCASHATATAKVELHPTMDATMTNDTLATVEMEDVASTNDTFATVKRKEVAGTKGSPIELDVEDAGDTYERPIELSDSDDDEAKAWSAQPSTQPSAPSFAKATSTPQARAAQPSAQSSARSSAKVTTAKPSAAATSSAQTVTDTAVPTSLQRLGGKPISAHLPKRRFRVLVSVYEQFVIEITSCQVSGGVLELKFQFLLWARSPVGGLDDRLAAQANAIKTSWPAKGCMASLCSSKTNSGRTASTQSKISAAPSLQVVPYARVSLS
jgi:hypothetical protein